MRRLGWEGSVVCGSRIAAVVSVQCRVVMKWLVLTCCLLWARHGEGGALKCVPDIENGSCSLDLQDSASETDTDTYKDLSPQEAECLAGSEWESNCHSCHCTSEGVAECLPQSRCDTPNTEKPIRCKPNTTFERDCNNCTCLENGLELCTLKNCQIIHTQSPSKENLPNGLDCAPGTTWQSQCNDCACSPEGLRFCTTRGCAYEVNSEQLLRCAPHSLWKNDCNTCWCTADGRAMCTKIGCTGFISDMNFSDEMKSSQSKETVELGQLPEVPDSLNNLLESDIIDPNEENLNEEDFDDIDNYIKTSKEIMEENKDEGLEDKNAKHEDFEDFEFSDTKKIQHGFKFLTLEESVSRTDDPKGMIIPDSKMTETPNVSGRNQIDIENVAKAESKDVHKDLEELSSSYIDQREVLHHVIKRSVCKPNQDFQSDCNTCKCSATGQSYACTQNECMDKDKEELDKEVEVFMESEGIDHIERHSVCKPRAEFYVGCNPCNCNVDGTDFSCTNKPCALPEDVEVFHELNAVKSAPKPSKSKKVCVENRMFIMNCNTCWCNEDGTSYFCTRKVCVPELPEEPIIEEGKPEKLRIIKRECRPDEVFELDCNMCRCNADGKSFSCTRRACVDEDSKNETQSRKIRAAPQEPPKSCQPGQEFRMDCNKCLCDNDGQDYSCTRIDCNAQNNNNNGGTRRKREVSKKVAADCVPGSVFDQDCNVCRCTEDGGHATCTIKRCSQDKANSTVSATESSFRCNPGEQFRRACNDCSCSADGKSVFCTLFLCDEDLTL